MSSPATILPFILLLLTSAAVTKTPTVHELLEEYNFPAGLLPSGVKSYTMNRDTGVFEVNLRDTCKLSAYGFDLICKSTISGVISKDNMTKLKGVSVKVGLLWMDIVKVTRDDDCFNFALGTSSAGHAVDIYEKLPQCGCGLYCNVLGIMEEKMKMANLTKLLNWSL